MAKRPPVVLSTTDEVIRFLGGHNAVAALTKRAVQNVYNWQACRRFPARCYLVMTRELERQGAVAPPALWGQDGCIVAA